MDVRVQLVPPVQDGEGGHRAQLALLLGDHLAAVQGAREEHAELAREVPVELLPRLEPDAPLDGMKQHLRCFLRLGLERLIHEGDPPCASPLLIRPRPSRSRGPRPRAGAAPYAAPEFGAEPGRSLCPALPATVAGRLVGGDAAEVRGAPGLTPRGIASSLSG